MVEMAEVMLTTVDNPFNPFEEFDSWLNYDMEKGYNSCGYLARIANTSIGVSDKMNEEEIERAIDEICDLNFLLYRKVYRNPPDQDD